MYIIYIHEYACIYMSSMTAKNWTQSLARLAAQKHQLIICRKSRRSSSKPTCDLAISCQKIGVWYTVIHWWDIIPATTRQNCQQHHPGGCHLATPRVAHLGGLGPASGIVFFLEPSSIVKCSRTIMHWHIPYTYIHIHTIYIPYACTVHTFTYHIHPYTFLGPTTWRKTTLTLNKKLHTKSYSLIFPIHMIHSTWMGVTMATKAIQAEVRICHAIW